MGGGGGGGGGARRTCCIDYLYLLRRKGWGSRVAFDSEIMSGEGKRYER